MTATLQRLAPERARAVADAADAARRAKASFLDKSRAQDRNRDGDEAVRQLEASQAPLAADDSAEQARLRAELAGLAPEARRELMALASIGRGEFAPAEWSAALAAAEQRSTAADVDRLSDSTALHDDLAKGLHLLGLS